MRQLIPRKQVFELRRKICLGFYSVMDSAGQALLKEFSDWKRTPMALWMENREAGVRVQIGNEIVSVEMDCEKERQEDTDKAIQWLKTITDKLDWEETIRVGVRRWYAVEIDLTHMALKERLVNRLLTIPTFDLSVRDFHCVIELGQMADRECQAGDGGRAVFGPMTSKEWFDHVPYKEPTHLPRFERWKQNLVTSLPDCFAFFDIDIFRFDAAGMDSDTVFSALDDLLKRSSTSAKDFTGAIL